MTEDIPCTHRFVGSSDTRKSIARASLGQAHRMRRQWVFYSIVLVSFAVLLMSGMSRDFSSGTRIGWAIMFALLPTLVVAVLVSVIAYSQMVRRSRFLLFKDAVLESGFGADEMVFRNPIAAIRIAYTGIESVTPRGNFVFVQQQGLPRVTVYPRDLFPDEAIYRILLARRSGGLASN